MKRPGFFDGISEESAAPGPAGGDDSGVHRPHGSSWAPAGSAGSAGQYTGGAWVPGMTTTVWQRWPVDAGLFAESTIAARRYEPRADGSESPDAAAWTERVDQAVHGMDAVDKAGMDAWMAAHAASATPELFEARLVAAWESRQEVTSCVVPDDDAQTDDAGHAQVGDDADSDQDDDQAGDLLTAQAVTEADTANAAADAGVAATADDGADDGS